MNLACVLPLHACWLAGREGTPQQANRFSPRQVAWHSLLALVLGCLLGGLQYWLGEDSLREAWSRLPARAYRFALSELAFSAACIGWLMFLFPPISGGIELTRKRSALAWILAVLSSSNLLYHFPSLMSVLGKLTANPSWSRLEQLPRKELLLLMKQPDILAISVHFAMASVAVALVYVLWLFASEWSHEDLQHSGRMLAGVALLISLLQFGVGVWLLASLPAESRDRLLGGDMIAAIAFGGGIFSTLLLCGSLANIALGKVTQADSRKAAMWTVVTVLLMTVALKGIRSAKATVEQKEPRQKTATARLVS